MIDILIIFVLGFMPAIVFHEVAHGMVAYWCGDPTAKAAGRLTLNPIAHVDPIGSIVLPLVLVAINTFTSMNVPVFAWAKPVPVNYQRLNNPKQDMALVAAAGPLINIIIAFVFGRLWQLDLVSWLNNPVIFFGMELPLAMWVILINVALAVFNMIPIPPLDGSRILMWLLPETLARPYRKLERYGIIIIILLLQFGFIRWIWPVTIFIVKLIGAS